MSAVGFWICEHAASAWHPPLLFASPFVYECLLLLRFLVVVEHGLEQGLTIPEVRLPCIVEEDLDED
jgi:hypothetical protein